MNVSCFLQPRVYYSSRSDSAETRQRTKGRICQLWTGKGQNFVDTIHASKRTQHARQRLKEWILYAKSSEIVHRWVT